MNLHDDDDLPVLTHVLRTGPVERLVGPPPGDERAIVDHAVRDAEPPLLVDPLVIGHDAHADVEDYLTPLAHDGAHGEDPQPFHSSTSDVQAADAFALSQDVDAAVDDARPTPIDEPHIAMVEDASVEHVVEPAAAIPSPDAVEPLAEMAGVAEAPPSAPDTSQVDPVDVARRVRDAVLDGLGARIDTELDARIAQAIHAEVETAFARLQVQLRTQLTEALRDVVGRAVDEEIALSLASRPPADAADHHG